MRFIKEFKIIEGTAVVIALCSDGTLWLHDVEKNQWTPFPEIPEPDNALNALKKIS